MADKIESTEQTIIACSQCGTKYDFEKEIAENMFESVDEREIILKVDYPYFYCGKCHAEMVAEE